MFRDARNAFAAVLAASFVCALLLSGCAAGDDDPDIAGPLESTGLPISSSGQGALDLPTSVDNSSTQVWEVTNDWADTDTAAAREAGMAWPANSGMNWEEKYTAWVQKMRATNVHASTIKETFILSNPQGKELPLASLECAELAMTLRVMFASWYNLPFYLQARDSDGSTLYAGHFGFRTPAGRYRNTPNYRDRYNDYSHLSADDALASWPTDTKLRGRHLYGGGSDTNRFLDPDAGAGWYFDEILLNKRVGYFLTHLLPYFGSINLADDANLYHVEAPSVRAGDTLLKRWQKRGIGHVMVVKRVEPVGGGRLEANIVSGSMPRRQGIWESPSSSKMAFTNQYTGGEGENWDGDTYVDLGGGLKRFLAPIKTNGRWRQRVLPADMPNFIPWENKAERAARPGIFEELLGEPDPDVLLAELLELIELKRDHLRKYPASCSARTGREQAFEQLYKLMDEKFPSPNPEAPAGTGWTRDEVDEEYRILDDYVFAELVYNQSKTCCWNSTTSNMYEIIMDHANQEAQEDPCQPPTVFMNQDGGYGIFSDHAAQMDRADEWVAWSADESCPQAETLNDVQKTHGWTPWCEIMSEPGSDSTPAGQDPFEPNEVLEQAYELEVGTYDESSITSNDEDWFVFTPPTHATVLVSVYYDSGDADLGLEIYRGSELVETSAETEPGELTVSKQYDGTELLSVRLFSEDGGTAMYRIVVEFEGGIDLGPACSVDNNNKDDAIEIGAAGTYNELAICDNDGEDWYRIGGTVGGGSVRIEFSHTTGDLDLQLLRADGEIIDSGTSTTDNEEVESPGSVRFVRVYGYSGATAPYRLIIVDD